MASATELRDAIEDADVFVLAAANRQLEGPIQRAGEMPVAAEMTSAAKSGFLVTIGREICTPMNAIIGMTELALDTDLTTKQREYLETVRTSADSLLNLINDILDFSKAEAGKLQVDAIQTSFPNDVVHDAHREREPLKASRKLQILLAEDSPLNQKVAVNFLEKWGHSVVVVGDGQAVLRAYKQQYFDAILMDVQMPEMDGLEATVRIRRDESETGRHIPIVALTAHATQRDRAMCLEAGMDAHVSKPIRRYELMSTIDEVIGNCGDGVMEPHEVSSAERNLSPEDAPATSPFDRSAALAYLGGNEQLLKEAAALFLGSIPSLLVEIQESFDCGDLKMLARKVHSLKGAVGNFSAKSAYDMAANLETAAREGHGQTVREIWPPLQREVSSLATSLEHIVSEES